MRIKAVPDNPIERFLDLLGLIPRPLMDTFDGLILAQCVMVAAKTGAFDALAGGPKTARQLAHEIQTDAGSTEKLLNALCQAGYLKFDRGSYRVTRMVRTWLLKSSKISLHDGILLRFLEWEAIGSLEQFVRSGQAIDIHDAMTTEQWKTYQRGMKSFAALAAREVARRIPLPKGSRRMLDLGGSHGLYSVALCRRYPGLSAVIYDLPEAVEHSAPLLAEEKMGERVVHRVANVLTADLGEDEWDLVFVSQLLHHFTEEASRDLLKRIERALRPRGVLAIAELLRPESPRHGGQTGAFFDLYFGLTSRSGTRSADECTAWVRETGLVPRKLIRLLTAPGVGLICGQKPPK